MSEHWYVARVQPQRYALASAMLSRQGFDVYDPFAYERGKDVRLFPGYLLVQCGEIPWQRAHYTPGVAGLLPRHRSAITIPIGLINRIRGYVADRLCADEVAWKLGEEACVLSGPFVGWRGSVVGIAGRSIVLELIIFRRATRVTLDEQDVQKIVA